jgi:hypothetical protein
MMPGPMPLFPSIIIHKKSLFLRQAERRGSSHFLLFNSPEPILQKMLVLFGSDTLFCVVLVVLVLVLFFVSRARPDIFT